MLKQLSENVFLFADTCNVYVIRSGPDAVLVDFGDGGVLEHLPAIGVQQVTDILMTHHHRDQGQGLTRWLRPAAPGLMTGARLRVPHAEQDLFHSVGEHWQAREIFNSYSSRQDRFSLLEPVPVYATLRDYSTLPIGEHVFMIVPTPGHTTGSVSLLARIDGRLVAFTGDLLSAPGKVWSLAATQWSYNGGEGIPGSILSLLDLRDRAPDLLLPSHGEPMHDSGTAISLTVEGLTSLRDLRGQNPRLFHLRESPYEHVTEHLLRNRTSMSDAYVLVSRSGKALFIDFGYDFMFGPALGQDRASRRPWLQTIPALKRQFGVTAIDVVIPTHYHDDHVAGINLLKEVEGTHLWAPENFAGILANPAAFDLPCLWYDPIPPDRVLPLGRPIQWEEYEFTLYELSGHTHYAVAIAFEADGRRILATGDQQGNTDGLFLNYVYKNGFQIADYRVAAALYEQLQPDLLLTGHWGVFQVPPGYAAQLRERGEALERLHLQLLAPGFGAEALQAAILPYQARGTAGRPVELEVRLVNPYPHATDATLSLSVPSGWECHPPTASLRLNPGQQASARFSVTAPPGTAARRSRVAADVAIGERRMGQIAEALITVTDKGENPGVI